MNSIGTIDIGEVTKASKTSASKLRYYEQQGLIESVGRNGLRRQYDTKVIDQLAFIKLAQIAGFTLDEIRGMSSNKEFEVDREKISARADRVMAHVKELTALHAMLQHMINCPEANHFDCPKFQQLLRLAPKHRT